MPLNVVKQYAPQHYGAHAAYLEMGPVQQRQAFISAGLRAVGVRKDSVPGITLARQLESMWAKAYRVKRTPLTGRTLVPRDTETAPWAEGYRYPVFDHVGAAVLLKTYRERLPRVSAVATEVFGRVWGYGTSTGWTELERMQATNANTNLPTEEQAAAQRVLEERIEDSIAVGAADMGTTGLLNNADVPIVVLPNGAGGSAYWDEMEPREVLSHLDLIYETIRSQSGNTERMTTLVLPPRALAYLRNTPWSDNSDTSILDYWRSTHKDVEVVEEWTRCNTAGAGSVPRLVAYAQTPDHLRAIIPLEYTLLPLERQGFQYSAPAHVRAGGVQWLYPRSAVYADGFWDPAKV
jgi:hypothetical protein